MSLRSAFYLAVFLFSAPACRAQTEIGLIAADVFYTDGGSPNALRNGKEKSEFFRGSLLLGYQFNSRSDQLTIALISDEKIDEAQFGYSFVIPSLQDYTPFDGFPYIKAAFGLGNTYAQNLVLTHISYGLGAGFYAPIGGSAFRARFEAGYFKREWQTDRSGEEPLITPATWKDGELSFSIGIGYVW